MSTQTHIVCDECADFIKVIGHMSTKALRKMARERGWVFKRGTKGSRARDICKTCAFRNSMK